MFLVVLTHTVYAYTVGIAWILRCFYLLSPMHSSALLQNGRLVDCCCRRRYADILSTILCLQALKAAGCDEVVLAINYQPKASCIPYRCTLVAVLGRFVLPQRIYHQTNACLTLLHDLLKMAACLAQQVMMDFLKEWEEKLAIKITCSQVSLMSLFPSLCNMA